MRVHPSGVLAAIALLATGRLAAQAGDSLPAFNSVRTPVSPAFVLLGIAPTSVERPNTPADLAFAVLNRTVGPPGLPKDVALEFSPYWLVRHPKLTWQADTIRSPLTSLARTATISLATAELDTDASPVTGLAVAFRGTIASGRLSRETIDRLRQVEASLTEESEVLERLIGPARAAADSLMRSERAEARARGDSAGARAAVARFNATKQLLIAEAQMSPDYVAAVDSTEGLLKDLAANRQGLVVEFAAGAVWSAPGGAVDSARVSRWGAWVTAGYQSPSWSFVAVNRFLTAVSDTASDVLDVGLRLIHSERRWALSGEAVFRAFTGSGGPPNQHRIAGILDYAIGNGLWVTATVGRDFDPAASGSLLAQFGISFGLSGERVQTP
ncbi:MAG TPA: hypothetical protein VGQ18_13390 [Gemmatimonadales bacterium]|nr:hypothetical protein [Gemmatimonadales bacterium]